MRGLYLPAMRPLALGHSPDPDDAFMFYALRAGRVDTEGLEFVHVLEDIETLNARARDGELEVTAVSLHAWTHLGGRYQLLATGASVGDGYGPIVVSRDGGPLGGRIVAVPGTLTTAFLALRLHLGDFPFKVVPFDRILDAVRQGDADAGLVIHEGQLTWSGLGLKKVVDLGEWWKRETGLPLPLGVNVVRRDLGPEVCSAVARVLRRSIRWGLEHRREAVADAMRYGRGLDQARTDRFVGMYVNDFTLDLGPRGREGARVLLARALERGLIPDPGPLEPVSEDR